MGKRLGLFGVIVTVAYFAGLLCLTWSRLPSMLTKDLNELGDFLAGAFGPIAILWLVLGFFQQGIELRQNSEALLLQAEELKNSVEQQAELVKVAREQLASDKEQIAEERQRLMQESANQIELAQPKFVFKHTGSQQAGSGIHLQVRLMNIGYQQCADLRIEYPVNGGTQSASFDHLNPNNPVDLTLASAVLFPNFTMQLSYYDGMGNHRRQEGVEEIYLSRARSMRACASQTQAAA